jgi:hypothetical protein
LGEQGVLTLNQMNHFLKARDYESLSKFLFWEIYYIKTDPQ